MVDRNQTGNAVLRNFPVIGHFRYWFLHLGEFFRQYLYSSDREELPFNRAQRVWVYRAAKNAENTNAFGSTRDLRGEGVPFFVNAPFPALGDRTPSLGRYGSVRTRASRMITPHSSISRR